VIGDAGEDVPEIQSLEPGIAVGMKNAVSGA